MISKAQDKEHRETLYELFNSKEKLGFNFDNKELNYLYMNGIIRFEITEDSNGEKTTYSKFSCPFIQKRLFNRFSNDLYRHLGNIIAPLENIDHIYNGIDLNIKNLIRRFEKYLKENKSWLLKDPPRRKSDMKISEAAFHFIFYSWVSQFLNQIASVSPEFPTGNGKVDLLIKKNADIYGLELKSFVNTHVLKKSIHQAALYAKQLKLSEFYLVIFIESIDDTNRAKYEIDTLDAETNVTIYPMFVVTGDNQLIIE